MRRTLQNTNRDWHLTFLAGCLIAQACIKLCNKQNHGVQEKHWNRIEEQSPKRTLEDLPPHWIPSLFISWSNQVQWIHVVKPPTQNDPTYQTNVWTGKVR